MPKLKVRYPRLLFPEHVSMHLVPNKAGYIEARCTNHPILGTCRTYVHRVIISELLGRKLTTREQVHHRNGKGYDNRRRNLVYKENQKHHRQCHRVPCSPERARKISEAKKGKPQPWARKLALAFKGVKRSWRFKKKVSEGMKRYCASLPDGEMARRARKIQKGAKSATQPVAV